MLLNHWPCLQKKRRCESNSEKSGGGSKPQGGTDSTAAAKVKKSKGVETGGSERKGTGGRVKVHVLLILL